MDLSLLPIDQFQLYLVVFCRVAGFIGATPVIASGQAPMQIKVALAVMVTLLLFPIMSPQLQLGELPLPLFALLVASELLVGLLIGFIAKLIFTAVEFGATVIGYQMGFAAANVFDPQTKGQISLISQFQNCFAILIFLAIDGHHIFLQTAVESYNYLPPGHFNYSGDAFPYLVKLMAHMFELGIQFSAPVLSVLLLSGLILGILARVFPQLNVFMLSFPINIGLAFSVIFLTLGLLAMLLSREFDNLPIRIINIISLLK